MRQEEWIKYLEPEEEDLMEAEALLWNDSDGSPDCFAQEYEKMRARVGVPAPKRSPKGLPSGRRWLVLLAACMLTAAFGIAALAAGQQKNGWFLSYFQITDEETQELLDQMEVKAGDAAEDAGYRIGVTESISDGKRIYALLTVTAPEGVPFEEQRQYTLRAMPWEADRKNSGSTTCLAGGGYVEEVERPAPDQAVFLFVWDTNRQMAHRQVILKITEITAYAREGITEERVAQGQWDLVLNLSETQTRTVRLWKKLKAGEDTWYVTEIEISPLGVRIHAVKAVSFSNLWKTAEYVVKQYVFHLNPPMPEGWGKESFEKLPVTAVYQDGSTVQAGTQSHAGHGFSCEKSVSFGQKKLLDPAKLQELRLGDTVLKIRE